ncbi:MAG: ABC transporter permease [Butyrivibrio sp.]|nr:ABC transporter permease [Muribaculum sp.]MCM1551965.1 ABC transporter permease [Butyrivibrio sp.]
MAEHTLLLIKSNIRKSIKTSLAFFLLCVVTILLSYTGNQMTEGFQSLYQAKIAETNSADFAALLPYDFCEKYRAEIVDFQKQNTDISELEITEAILIKNADICGGDQETINGSWMFRNADRKEKLSTLRLVNCLGQIPENGIYVPYVCKTFFGFKLGDPLQIFFGEGQETFIIAGFTEDVLFGSRSNLIFDLPKEQFEHLKSKSGTDSNAALVLMKTSGQVGEVTKRFSEFVASRADEIEFYGNSDIEYAESSRNNNINIYVTIISVASLIGILTCFIVIGFHMRNTLDKDLKELGTLKAIGYGGNEIAISYVLQFLLLGALGAIVGIVISQSLMPVIISNIATDIGFEWKNVSISFASIKSILTILLMIGIVSFGLSRGVRKLRPIEAFKETGQILNDKGSRLTVERLPFSVNLSIVLKMMDYRRVKSILTCIVVAAMMSVAGFAMILYVRLTADREGLLKITGAEVYSVNVQAARPSETEELAAKIAGENNGTEVRKVMTAIGLGSARLLCEKDIYASLGVYSDYSALENPSLYAGRYPKHENEAAISANLAQLSGKEIGDTINVSHIFQEEAKETDYLIVGLTQGTYTGGIDIYLTMSGLKQIDPEAEWQEIHIYLEENADVEGYCLDLKNSYMEHLAYVGVFEQVFYSQLSPIVNSVAGIVYFIIVIVFILIVIMGVFVTDSILLTQKRDFGIMKALGYSNGQIISQAVLNFMLYIAGGSILGSLFLYFGANAVISGLFRGMGVYKIAFPFPAAWIAMLFLCMEIVGGMTAFVVAWRVKRIVPCGLINTD